MTCCSPLGAEFPGRRCLCGLMSVEQSAVGGKQWSRVSTSPCSLAALWWGRDRCLGLLPLMGSGLYSKCRERAELHSSVASSGDAKSQPKLFTSVSLSWFLALVSQVLPLCGLLNKSPTSCPFSWHRDAGTVLHPSVRLPGLLQLPGFPFIQTI